MKTLSGILGGKVRWKVIVIPVTDSLAVMVDLLCSLTRVSQETFERPEVNHPFPDVPYVKGIFQCIVGVRPLQL